MTISELLQQAQNAAVEAAKQMAEEYAIPAAKDAVEFIGHASADLARYVTLYVEHKISADELADLVKGKGALATMRAVTIAGMAEIKIAELKDKILSTVSAVLGSAVKGLA